MQRRMEIWNSQCCFAPFSSSSCKKLRNHLDRHEYGNWAAQLVQQLMKDFLCDLFFRWLISNWALLTQSCWKLYSTFVWAALTAGELQVLTLNNIWSCTNSIFWHKFSRTRPFLVQFRIGVVFGAPDPGYSNLPLQRRQHQALMHLATSPNAFACYNPTTCPCTCIWT